MSDLIDDISMFADTVHTNEQGAFIIADKLINLLEPISKVKNHAVISNNMFR